MPILPLQNDIKPINLTNVSTEAFHHLFTLSQSACVVSRGLKGNICPNASFAKELGYSRDELELMTIQEITPKKWVKWELKHQRSALLTDGHTTLYEKEFIKKDGSILPIEAQIFLLEKAKDFNDSIFVTLTKDISSKRKLKTKAQESEQRFKLLSEATFEAIIVLQDKLCVDINTKAEKLFDYSLSELKGKPCSFLIAKQDRQLASRKMEEGFEGFYQASALRKDGSTFPAEIHAKNMQFGEKYFRIVALTDISERVLNQQKLGKSEQRLKEAQELAQLGSYEMDFENDIWQSSDVLNGIFGINLQYRKDRSGWLKIVHPEDQAMMQEYLMTNILTNHEKFDKEYRIIRLNDKILRWVHGLGKLTLNKQGKPSRLAGTIQDVTERKLAHDLIRTNEERLYLAAKSVKLGHFDWRPLTELPHWDYQMREFFELDDTFDGDPHQFFTENIHPDDQDRMMHEFVESMNPSNEKKQFKSQFRILLKSGTLKHLECNSIHFKNKKGNVTRVVGTCSDITERILTKTALEQSESKFRSFFEQNTSIMFQINTDKFEVIDCNDVALQFYGYSREEFKNFSLMDLNAAGDEEVRRLMKSVLKKKSLHFETQHKLKDGSIRDVEVSSCLIGFKEGQNLFTIINDITEKRQALQSLQENKERLELATTASKMGCYDWNIEKDQLLWDDQMHRIFGLNLKSNTDKSQYFLDLLHPKDLKRIEGSIESVFQSQANDDTLDTEFSIILRNGNIRHIESHAIFFKGDDDSINRVIGNCVDITERKNTENKLKTSEDQLSLIYNSTSDCMILLRVEKDHIIIESVNRVFQDLKTNLGQEVEQEDLIGMHVGYYLGRVLNFEEREVMFRIAKYQEVIRNKQPGHYLGEVRRGERLEYSENTVTPIIRNGKVSHLLWVSRDVTETILGRRQLELSFKEVNRLKSQLEKENIYLREEIELSHNYEEMVFSSVEFKDVLAQTERVAVTDASVLIQGETGTGKELIARAIHNISTRKHKPIIKVNCAAIPDELIESELFGHERGSFTGATHQKLGKFELANHGTLFLDEIGEMPIYLQPKILRALQEGEIERVGSTKSIKVDVRIISASNKNLKVETQKGNFREDLYFRLNVFPITLPPLRDRADDIPVLVDHFVNKFSIKLGKKIEYISEEAMRYLKAYSWPGNVRELENLIERSVILSTSEYLEIPEVNASNLRKVIKNQRVTLDDFITGHIQKTLAQCNWKIDGKNGASEMLGMKPSTLRDKMKKLGIQRPKPIQRYSDVLG